MSANIDFSIKACSKCKSHKKLEDFYRHPKGINGRSGECKACAKHRSFSRMDGIDKQKEKDNIDFFANIRRELGLEE